MSGLVMLTVGSNDALLAAGALSLTIAMLLGAYAYRHRYQAQGDHHLATWPHPTHASSC
ncbi:hypothetical protein ACI2LC_42435 [Nonomuraea wenchangensis]|uniref:hypothetical protein n=1 Tax=Nonomuraea wenchangensis TaxID=568860 RepID=UPI00384AB73E